MPVLWRYLLRSYFQVYALCVTGFIAILLVMRFQEIAKFACSGAAKSTIFLFAVYQIPFILPFAIPISCLIAAILLFQRLSHTHELTALRASGLGLKVIVYPLMLGGTLLALVNFGMVSELAPRCRGLSKNLIYDMTALNPLFLFQKETLVKLRNSYVDMKVLKSGKYAEDVVFIMKNLSNQRLGIMIAKELSMNGDLLEGNKVTFISSVDPKRPDSFDHLVIENQREMSTKACLLSQFVENPNFHFSYDYLPLRLILAKKTMDKSFSIFKFAQAHEEIARRLSLAFAAFTFTFIGVTFGMKIGRNHSKRGVFWALGLSCSFLICFMVAKSLKHAPGISVMLYLLPHPLLILVSLRSLKRVSEGIE